MTRPMDLAARVDACASRGDFADVEVLGAAIVQELRTLNLLLASHLLSDGETAEAVRRRLGIDQGRDSAEDGQG